jgi:hypothetical protein
MPAAVLASRTGTGEYSGTVTGNASGSGIDDAH